MVNQGDWVKCARPALESHMARYESGRIEFAVLGVVKDPLNELRDLFAENIRTLRLMHEHENDGQTSNDQPDTISPHTRYGISQEMLDRVDLSSNDFRPSEEGVTRPTDIDERARKLIEEQATLKSSIQEAQDALDHNQEKSEGLRFDFGPALRKWILCQARSGVVETLLTVD